LTKYFVGWYRRGVLNRSSSQISPEIASVALIRNPDQATALLQPERLRLLGALVNPDSASGLAKRFDLPRQRLNYHLRELERVGLVDLIDERRRGNCIERVVRATARAYVISPEVLGGLGDSPDEDRDRFSALHLVQVAARTIREVSDLVARAKASGKRLATLTLDMRIRFATPTTRARFAQELTASVAALVERYHDEDTPGGRECRFTSAAYERPQSS
jgi:DNA-binding transcriptional ArsR family regulator